MGQAFDGAGNVLGEAYGDSKREVFEELERRHKAAAEIRIKSMPDQPPGPARSALEHAEALEHMARYRRDGRLSEGRTVAALAEAESCAAGASALRELAESNGLLDRHADALLAKLTKQQK